MKLLVWGIAMAVGLVAGCGDSDLGTCVIKKSGEDVVIENITFEECQDRGLEEPGARGIEWRPG